MITSMGHRKDILENVVSHIACVSMDHQNRLEQIANEAMFATHVPMDHIQIVV
jgi:hypothetical protein